MQTDHTPFVTVLSPESQRGRTFHLGEADILVGRAEACDLRFEDPYLSRLHAKLERRGDRLQVRDLGSSGGTFVNDDEVETVRELHDGDVVTLGSVSLQLTADELTGTGTRVMPTVRSDAAGGRRVAPAEHSARYDVRDQHAGTLNNVARDQYNQYVHQRESFLREVAATRTRARGLMWLGFIVFALGFGAQIVGSVGYAQGITSSLDEGFSGIGSDKPPAMLSMGGFQIAFIGAAVASVGVVLFMVGLVLHIVAASRRKRVDREMPLNSYPAVF
jgi:hypothetical protein